MVLTERMKMRERQWNMKQTFNNLRAILTRHKENMPVVVLAEMLAEIDEAEAKWGCHAICYLDSHCEYQNEDIRIEEADCCEWNQERQEKIKYGVTRVTFGMRTSCGKLIPHLSTDFKFCQYCGKPIKISEV